MQLSAAETSFGRAIEKDPSRWDCYLAFAHTQYRYERYDSVVDLCGHILALRPSWSAEAKTRELLARALLRRRPDDYGKAFAHARRASQLALRCLLQSPTLCGVRRREPRTTTSRGARSWPRAACSRSATSTHGR